MKVLAIGATGFIGRRVVPLLIEPGHDVAVLHRGDTAAELPVATRHILGDRNRLKDRRAEIERFAPEVVLDLILYTERQAVELVQECQQRVARVVALSSADVYRNYDGLRGKSVAPADPVPLTENAPLRETRYPYRGERSRLEYANDYEKILVEQALLGAADLETTILRLTAVYGPGDRQHRLRPYLQRMQDGRAAILLGEAQAQWRWTRGFVENVAAAVALAVTSAGPDSHVYNVGEDPTLSEREWVERIGIAAGWPGRVVTLPDAELPAGLRLSLDFAHDLWTDTTRFRRELGYAEPVARDEALRRTVEWERRKLQGAPPLDYAAEDSLLASLEHA